jgi:alpha,alpha-trehalose phosphorylase
MKSYLIEENALPKNKAHHETLFSLGNGFIGFRGSFYEEGSATEGCFINNFYETHPIKYGEKAYGFPEITESMVNIPNPRNIALIIDGESCILDKAHVKDYKRILDLKTGVLSVTYTYTKDDKKLKVTSEALVSFYYKNISVIKYTVTPLNFDGTVEIISSLNKRSKALVAKDDPRVADIEKPSFYVDEKILAGDTYGYRFKTFETKKSVLLLEELKVNRGKLTSGEIYEKVKYNHHLSFEGQKNETIEVLKINEIYLDEKRKTYENLDFEFLKEKQEAYLDDFWEKSEVNLENNEDLTQGIRFNLFHLLQSVNKTGDFGIAAKGLTGEGYEGHNFWDTEIFIFPFFLFTQPEIAKNLLIYRYKTLEKSKARARILGYEKGVKFPWRSISGIECSGYFPAGTAQYHINADIAYAVGQYYEVTGDEDFMKDYGNEILLETARFFIEVGHMHKGKFKIDCVTGPDEYTALVNNNYYTNKMVQANLKNAYKYLKKYEVDGVSKDELATFKKAYENMYLPFDEDLKLTPQDDSFLDKEVWDFENTPKERYPLLLHYHPMKIYKHQVCKQADVCLADFLVGDDVPLEVKENNFNYYMKVTTHDSSLSYNTYGIMACEIDYLDEAYDLYTKNVRLDIDNSHNNSNHGIHTAAMGGSWLGLVFGFGGMRLKDGELYFNPKFTKALGSYSFVIQYQGKVIKVSVNSNTVIYTLLKGEQIDFYNTITKIQLTEKAPEFMV